MKLKELMKNNKTKRENLSKNLQIPLGTLDNYIAERREPDITTLCKIANYFNVSLDYLCERTDTKNELPVLTNEQKQLVNILIQLNEINFIKVVSYASGLLAGQN